MLITGTGLSKLLPGIQSLTLEHLSMEKNAGASITEIEVGIRESEN